MIPLYMRKKLRKRKLKMEKRKQQQRLIRTKRERQMQRDQNPPRKAKTKIPSGTPSAAGNRITKANATRKKPVAVRKRGLG